MGWSYARQVDDKWTKLVTEWELNWGQRKVGRQRARTIKALIIYL